MKLIGSTTSPYVRKIRLLLAGQNYEFETLKALSPEGGQRLEEYGAIKRIPILIYNDKTYFDSSIIFEFLLEEKGLKLSIDEKLGLRLIDELCDSGITLFQQKLWQIDEKWEDERSIRFLRRANLILDELNVKINELTEFQKDWLFCVLDWLRHRSVVDWRANREKLVSFFEACNEMDKYKDTSPDL